MKRIMLIACASLLLCVSQAFARDIRYTGNEETIFVRPGEPTQITFPGAVEGGFKPAKSSIALDKQDNFIVVFAKATLPPEGEAIIVHIDDKRSYALRMRPASVDQPRDGQIKIVDTRPPETDDDTEVQTQQRTGFAPPTVISGLMREMVLVAEFGKKRGVPGYRRSNAYSGEVVLHDGAIRATIDEIFMGPNLWGYVLNVENLRGTTQKINPATFRIDGTRAVSAQHWELAPKPLTAEQESANQHRSKVYIVTRAKR